MNLAYKQRIPARGPFTADQIRDGDRYELSNGHAIYCAPAGEHHARRNASGASLLGSDPEAEWSAVDAGFTPNPGTLRAPDVAVGPKPAKKKGAWIAGAPPLAVEYADRGQHEPGLQIKIKELLVAGTRYVWVVRLTGPQRVEVYTKGKPMRLFSTTDTLEAQGVLKNPIPVRALFDDEEAARITLRNLLQREGYEDLNAVLQEGALAAKRGALLDILSARGIAVDEGTGERIADCRDSARLDAWLGKAAVADQLAAVFEE
uniref:Restriction endonuclease n=1 Tax=Candidatus Kentrum sp. DK TaxID=2126562 RepID=A0A450SU51_9GAMM|nr:MAG: Putative restriction endonuclease [Candidatus Kentron sp. DK]VFJ57458.1 MAG: Putative restriction endonuclease [Candidatus Kentron sp. DK]